MTQHPPDDREELEACDLSGVRLQSPHRCLCDDVFDGEVRMWGPDPP
jgi:hypothetical protein